MPSSAGRAAVFVASLFCGVCYSTPAAAFDYLEHSYFADRACREAQMRLAPLLDNGSTKVAARYLSLALFCPERWTPVYCADDVKQVVGNINGLDAPPSESGDHAVTFGDLVALPDHVSAFGPVRGFPRVTRDGLIAQLFRWMAAEPGDAGGVVGDVAEDACETEDLVDWAGQEADVAAELRELEAGGVQDTPASWLDGRRRSPMPQGPSDPAGAYSFDNPHYLDLVLRNQHHFGTPSYGIWLGFHGAAIDVAHAPCEEVIGLDGDSLEDLADDVGEMQDQDWDALTPEGGRRAGCDLLRRIVTARVMRWSTRADAELVDPARRWLDELKDNPGLADGIVAASMSLVLEGAGLHFLHDSLASGHLRTERSVRGLGERRHDHDSDSANGVVASWASASGRRTILLFGDNHVIGPLDGTKQCTSTDASSLAPHEVSGCLLRRQRGLLVGTGTASLLDWALGGVRYGSSLEHHGEDNACADLDEPERVVCRLLATEAPRLAGLGQTAPPALGIQPGTLPVPPPPFSYEAVRVNLSLDGRGRASQFGLRAVLLSELDSWADWMTSYQLAASIAQRPGDRRQANANFAYVFHWRWAARWLINLGAFSQIGVGGLSRDRFLLASMGPSVGTSLLPQGWTKIPIEFTFTYRAPLTLFDSRDAFTTKAIRLRTHWIELAVGLAFL